MTVRRILSLPFEESDVGDTSRSDSLPLFDRSTTAVTTLRLHLLGVPQVNTLGHLKKGQIRVRRKQ